MDPARRKLLRVDLTDAVEAEEMFTRLMGTKSSHADNSLRITR
jgi:DNA gyrase/topoisomerase IV subunit B